MDIGTLTGQIVIEDELSSALTIVTAHVKKFAEGFEGALGAIGIGAGVAATAIAGVTASVIALGNRGSDINDVTATFESFTGSVENAESVMDKMRSGVKGTITDFNLMKSSSKLLAADVKLSADQFGTLSSAAFVLQNRGLGPTSQMLDMLSSALLTGRTRSLEMQIGKIDLTKAEKDYADKLGISVKELTPLQELEAKRAGLLDHYSKMVKQAGEQQRDFGEQMEFAVVSIQNWGNQLAARVAQSPSVTRAVQSIGDALVKHFGGSGKTAIEILVSWINKFADIVGKYGPVIIQWVASIRDWLVTAWDFVRRTWDDIPDWFKRIAEEAAIAGIAVYGTKSAIEAVTGESVLATVASFATIWSGFGKAISTATLALRGYVAAMVLATAVSGSLMPVITDLGNKMKWLATSPLGAILLVTAAIVAMYEAWNAASKESGWVRELSDSFEYAALRVQGYSAAEADAMIATRHLTERALEQKKVLDGIKPKVPIKLPEIKIPKLPEPTPALTKLIEDLTGQELIKQAKLWGQALQQPLVMERLSIAEQKKIADLLDDLTAKHIKVGSVGEAAYSRLATVAGKYRATLTDFPLDKIALPPPELISELSEQTVRLFATDLEQKFLQVWMEVVKPPQLVGLKGGSFEGAIRGLRSPTELISEISDQTLASAGLGTWTTGLLERTLGVSSAGLGKSVTSAIMGAIQGGGNVAQAAGSMLGGNLMEGWANRLTEGVGQTAKKITGWLGGAVSAAFPVIGSLIGSLVGPLMNKIVSIFDRNKGRDIVKEFAAGFGGFQPLHDQMLKMGPDMERYWIQLTQRVGRNNEAQAKQTVEEIQKIFEEHERIVQKYSITTQDALNDTAKTVGREYELLQTRFGKSTAEATSMVAGEINNLIRQSLVAGQKIPANLRPIIESMIKQGELTRENAQLILGLKDSAMPSLEEIRGAAERYGIELDALGPKVKQLEITELANQYVSDWEILTAATDDWGVLFDKMGPKVQDLITDAMKYGSELPANMKPMIQAFIDAGKLVDDQGVALTDLSKLTFAADLSEMFEDLMTKLDELIDKISIGVGGALEDIGNTVVRPRIEPDVTYPGYDAVEPTYAQHGTVIPFVPRGTDRVPAMLTPGERVLSVAENHDYERGRQPIVVKAPDVYLDGRKVSQNQMRHLPDSVKRAGGRR